MVDAAAAAIFILGAGSALSASRAEKELSAGEFKWVATPPLLQAVQAAGENWVSVKDPSVVWYKNSWHLFCTVRGQKRSHAIVYVTFADWSQADKAGPRVLPCHPGYFCAPQVFYFTPQKQWYLICQAADESWQPKYQPAWSRTAEVASPDSWSKLTPLFGGQPFGFAQGRPANVKAWLDFWVICNEGKAYLFFTSLDGKMWRAETPLAEFPSGWSTPVVALEGDVFEASHTYRLAGMDKYLTLIEAQGGHGWRYYKAYLADRLDGAWNPLAADKDKAFASMLNVQQPQGRWTDVISHGELLRAGYDQKLEADPDNLRFVFQGVLDQQRAGKAYGQIPWRLGILQPAKK